MGCKEVKKLIKEFFMGSNGIPTEMSLKESKV